MKALVVIGTELTERISRSGERAGTLAVSHDHRAGIVRVAGPRPDDSGEQPATGTGSDDGTAIWGRAVPALHLCHGPLLHLARALPIDTFFHCLDSGVRPVTSGHVVTYAPGAEPAWAAWEVKDDMVVPNVIDVLPPVTADPLDALTGGWPLADLRGEVVVIGLGSIGSAVAHGLARYGVRRLTFVDPGRLRWHNLVRHQNTADDLGRFKVDAVAEAITSRWPSAEVDTYRLNVIAAADQVRPLLRRCSLVVCAADGVGPRRAVSHLARRAHRTAVLACVLEDGGIGEVLRLRPWGESGCLLCVRAALSATGAMDPEPALDSDYGTGTSHRPMTAVGSDLALVGGFAAKVAVASLLEDAGHHDHRLPGDWALMGMRGDLDLAPPFDVAMGRIEWPRMPGPLPGCPTCGVA